MSHIICITTSCIKHVAKYFHVCPPKDICCKADTINWSLSSFDTYPCVVLV